MLAVFFNACGGVFTIFLVGLLGYLLARSGKVGPETATLLPKIVTTIVLPPYLLRSTTSTFEREQLLELLSVGGIPFVSIAIGFLLSMALVRILKVREGRKGVFKTGFSTSSAMNIGLPINMALFGEEALPYVLLYFFANASFFWTIGNYNIAHDGEKAGVKLFSKTTLKQICSPPLIGFFCGIALVLGDVHLPMFIDKAFKYVGDMAIGLSIMYVGIMLHSINLAECHIDRDMATVFIGRFVASPLCILALAAVFDIPPLARDVFIIQSSLPVMMNAAILAGYYKADVRFATMITSVSTLISLAVIPLFMVLITFFSTST